MEDFIKDSTALKIGVMLADFSVRPTKAHEEDAGFDLYMPLNQFGICRGHGSMEVDTGVHMVIPRGYFGKVEAKSGLNMKHNLTTTGVVDAQYTGSIRVKLYNHGDKTIEFKGGDKIAQIVIHKLPEVEVLPAQVSIKNCRDCTINIYPDQNIGVKNVPEQPQSVLPEILMAIFEKVNFYSAAGMPAVTYDDLIDAIRGD